MGIFTKLKSKLNRQSAFVEQMKAELEYKKTKKYRDKYVTRKEINHPYFGRLIFEIDSNEPDEDGNLIYHLVQGLKETPFDMLSIVNANVIFDVVEDKVEDALFWLEKAYQNAEQTINGFYDMLLKKWEEENVSLPNGNQFDKKFVEENFIIREMDVKVYDELIDNLDEVRIEFFGKLSDGNGDFLFNQNVICIEMNCKANKEEYIVCKFK